MISYYHVAISLIIKTSVVFSITVERLRGGDLFDAPCNSCHLYNGLCADGSIHIFDCCKKCACEFGATLYGDMCYTNLPQDQTQCEIFVEKDEYFGLKTRDISTTDITYIGYIKDKWYWNRQVFNKCIIDDESTYWDTKNWKKLFSDGRMISDFHLEGGHNGVQLKAFWYIDNIWQLYTGLLIKLSITCYSSNPIPHFGVDNHISKGSEQNGDYSLKSCLVTKFAGKRTYYEGTSPPIPGMTRSSTIKTSTIKTSTIKTSTVKTSTVKTPTVKTSTVKTSTAVSKTALLTTTGGYESTLSPPVKLTRKPPTVKTKTASPSTTDMKTIVKVTTKLGPSGMSTHEKLTPSISATITPETYIKGISYESFCRVVIPVVCVIIFVIVCLCWMVCRQRYAASSGDRSGLVVSYGSTDSSDSGSLLNSNEYAIIRTPTYSDIWELENWEKTRKKGGSNADREKSIKSSWKDNKGYEKIEDDCIPPTRIIAQESLESQETPYGGRQPSESSWDGTLYMHGNYT